jgi:predicted solute-binding protein
MRKHIDLYVNEYSLHLGETGHKAIETLEKVFISLPENKDLKAGHLPLFL